MRSVLCVRIYHPVAHLFLGQSLARAGETRSMMPGPAIYIYPLSQFISGAKIPSVLFYDYQNIVQLCGAETEDVVRLFRAADGLNIRDSFFSKDALIMADDQNWRRAEWQVIQNNPGLPN